MESSSPSVEIYSRCITQHLPLLSTHPALIYLDSSQTPKFFSYSDLHHQIVKISKIFQNLGVSPSDSILLILPQIQETFLLILACAQLKIHYSLISPLSNSVNFQRIISDFKPKIIFSASYCLDLNGVAVDYNKTLNEALNNINVNIVMIQRELYQTPIINEGRDLDFHTLMSFCGKDEIINIFSEETNDFELFSVFANSQNFGKITKNSKKTIAKIEETMKIQNPEENNVWISNFDLYSINGLCFIVYGPLLFGGTTILLENSYENEQMKFWQIIEKFNVNCFCGNVKIFENLENFGSLSSLGFLILEKNANLVNFVNFINERNFSSKEIDFDSQCFFENFYVKFENCDDFTSQFENIIKEETNSESVFIIKIDETLHIFIEEHNFFSQAKNKIEEIAKKCKFSFKIIVSQMEKESFGVVEQEIRKKLKLRVLMKNNGKNTDKRSFVSSEGINYDLPSKKMKI